MEPKLMLKLASRGPPGVIEAMVHLRDIFPEEDVGKMAARHPSLLVVEDSSADTAAVLEKIVRRYGDTSLNREPLVKY